MVPSIDCLHGIENSPKTTSGSVVIKLSEIMLKTVIINRFVDHVCTSTEYGDAM